MLISQLSVWYILLFGAVWAVGTAFLVSRALLRVQRVISKEIKSYLGLTLEDHRNKAAEIVGQGVQQQLVTVKEELSTALSNVVRAEAAQSVAEDAQSVAEVATQAKTDFLSRMSHEIRTPINGIVGSLALLEPMELTKQQAEDLQRAVLSSDRLMVVVNEVLDLAQIEADQVEFESVSFDLVQVCEEAVDSFQPLAAEKGLGLSCSLYGLAEGGYLSRRLGDQQKIHQVLTNLLSNAVKFTSHGEISLVAKVGYGDRVSLLVTDTGRGISKEQQGRVFQPFSADSSDGTGLGLSICQKYIEGMGGQISLASVPGMGSTFTVELGLPEDQEFYDNKKARPELKVRPSFGLRVLSVDDDEVNRRVVERHLQQLGCQVDSAENGQQAVERFTDGYDLVLMDLLMPQMDGFQAAREIRRLEQESGVGIADRVRIVAITASVVGKVEQQCRQAGMDGFLSKPFSKQQLQEVLNESKKDLDG